MDYRIEKDTMGEVKVPADKFWGAQTQRERELQNRFRKNASACCEGVCNFKKKHGDR